MKSHIEEKFSEFYDKWMTQLEVLLQLLVDVLQSQEQPYEEIVNKLTTHHKEYYTFKWATAHEDVLVFFTPIWLTPFENAHLWVTGWKPSTALRLLDSVAVAGLSRLTDEKITALRVKIKVEEERVEKEMERQQVMVADRRTVQLIRVEQNSAAGDKLSVMLEMTMQELLAGLEKTMKMADCVRLKTLKGILDILSPVQGAEFLASMSKFQIQLRKLGGEIKTQRFRHIQVLQRK